MLVDMLQLFYENKIDYRWKIERKVPQRRYCRI